ncbi:ATP-dependent helicase HrpB [Vibrio cincinnatiensis]|uniref:ATP-dependent helicase HrpB n=1 Tax=Vibrio cincinnatiensis TaxID=675 RepID=UPI001EDE4D97|nr:ATP-dependent helicase HrpB [Vibrio cincinnatiensis]MCG3735145.1 ATP-dependent helicase HrpB [Vibrio cincinnatiensis]MCG3746147.1 ATP-dependent helicase HrpB [Vibrio cincinnatiensis]
MSDLPIDVVIPELLTAIQHSPQVILKAPPGAGKSTQFPLALLRSAQVKGKVVMLEPRRLAVRNIARYLAQQLGENVGESVGYRIRGESQVSAKTRLEIVTEGILTRMIQHDPELTGVDLLIFDEFHERSLHADMALALSLDLQMALRENLTIVVMSATLDQQALQGLLPEARYIESQGRHYPVDIHYQPMKDNLSLVNGVEQQIRLLLAQQTGSLLAFLPGSGLIRQLQDRLSNLPSDIDVCPLYGQLPFTLQQQAIAPALHGRRKVVLATNIAETSLTIEGIRLVVDSGWERRARFEPKTGITRLEQVRIAQSSAQQRAGRAGRLEAGLCVRLYSEAQLNLQPSVPEPEILHSDLTALALELAQWGAQQASELKWLNIPPSAALSQARDRLTALQLMDGRGQLTPSGQAAHRLGIDPRIAAMLLWAKEKGSRYLHSALALAVLVEEPEHQILDLQHSLHRWQQGEHSKGKLMAQRAQALAQQLQGPFSLHEVDSDQMTMAACFAFSERLAQQRGQYGHYLLANGHGAFVHETHPLASQCYLLAVDLMRGQQQSSQIFSALTVDIEQLFAEVPTLFSELEWVDWDEKQGRLVAERQRRIGRLIIHRQTLAEPSLEKMTQALLNYVQRKGLSVLNWNSESQEWLARVRCASEWLPEEAWPDMSEAGLLAALHQWLAPYLIGLRSVKELHSVSVLEALMAYVAWPLTQQLDDWLPTHHQLPTGNRKKIRYQAGGDPVLSVRIQEVFGEQASPVIAKGRIAIVMELLSPAQRPLQITRDLASFWQGAYRDVQKEMKGRYPKHVWPDDPATHRATTKTKRHLNQ